MTSKTLTETASQKGQGGGHPTRKRLYTLKEGAAYLGRSEWGMRELIWPAPFRWSNSKPRARSSWTSTTLTGLWRRTSPFIADKC